MKNKLLILISFLAMVYSEKAVAGACPQGQEMVNNKCRLLEYCGPGCGVAFDEQRLNAEVYNTGGSGTFTQNNFYLNSTIENIVIHDGITNITQLTFRGTTNLKNVIFPDSLTTIGSSIFLGSNIENLYCTENTQTLCTQALTSTGKTAEQIKEILKPYQKYNDSYLIGGKFYKSLSDFGSDNYIQKRIFTVDEASALVKNNKNTFTLRYR